ncbi:DUF2917 domain-containing protein [Usitatibacter palustris]|uniref:DUF2917 domain-containing protein n=1 Tax=Usitatibacter palustris TaxID=2732487 RepID=A0A6M4H539_9PROT|nr:DUF2917 domain-containing protein [Usitatibacter palustris]QJR14068.1 hypothetical protein DSM104440_00861 [Usitatibacter palustris]
MELHLKAPLIALAPGEVIALDDVAGATIKPTRGTVWITEEGDTADFVLRPGERRVVQNEGRTVVQAIDCAWISIRESLPEAA